MTLEEELVTAGPLAQGSTELGPSIQGAARASERVGAVGCMGGLRGWR